MPHDQGAYREPMFNAPWPVLGLIAALVVAFLAQTFVLSPRAIESLALSADGLRAGAWHQLATHMFLHGGVGHLLMNAFAALAFAPPVVRLFGLGNGDVVLFFGYFLLCGVAGALTHLAFNWGSPAFLIGASGGISGLWGGASRLLGRRGDLAPILDRAVIGQGAAFVIINVLIGFLGAYAGLFIGWLAHIGGYVAGLLLIGMFARLAGRLR